MSTATVFSFANPIFDELQSVTLEHCDDEVAVAVSRQVHIYKTRELIFTERQVIATPVLQTPYHVLAVMQESLLDSQPFQERLKAMQLRVCSRERPHPHVFESCLRYTMVALLAPGWNQVGSYLCQGRDFLVATGVLPAVEWRVRATDRQTELTLAAGGIRLRHMTLADLLRTSKIDHATLVELRTTEVAIEPLQCHVLPSMTIATAISVSFMVFSDSPYGSFHELQRFWKNTYGYRIPGQTESAMIYVKVRFPSNPDRTYVYPILCVRPTEPRPLARVNPYPIILAFLQCVTLRMSQVCGQPFTILPRGPTLPTAQLRWTAMDAEDGIDNVSCTSSTSSEEVAYWPKVSSEAKPVTTFIGDMEIMPGSDDEDESADKSKPSSSTKFKPCFQAKQSHVHHSRVGAGTSKPPLHAPGPSCERMDTFPQVDLRAAALAFPDVVKWLNSCEFPVPQRTNNEVTKKKTVSFSESIAPRATGADTMSSTQTAASVGTANSQHTVQGQQLCRATVNAHSIHSVSGTETSEEARSKVTNLVTSAHVPQKMPTTLRGSTPALMKMHDASGGVAAKNTMSGHSGHTKAAQQLHKTCANYGDQWDSLATPAHNTSGASRSKTSANAADKIPTQAKTAELARGTSVQPGRMWSGSNSTAQNHDLAQHTTPSSSSVRFPTQARIDKPTLKTFSTLSKGMLGRATSAPRTTPTFNNVGRQFQSTQTASQPEFHKFGQPTVKPPVAPAVKQGTDSLSLTKTGKHSSITFDRHLSLQPRPLPPCKHNMANLLFKMNNEERITFDRRHSQKHVSTGAAKTIACAGKKAGQGQRSFSAVANASKAGEDPRAREIASQPVQSVPKETEDLPELCSTQVEGRKAPGKNSRGRKFWTVADVDNILRDKKFDMLSKVNSVVLLAWLYRNNVPCNVKTKKSYILSKITQHAAMG